MAARAVGSITLVAWAVVAAADEDILDSGGVGGLTGLGFSLLVGGPLLVLGALLLL